MNPRIDIERALAAGIVRGGPEALAEVGPGIIAELASPRWRRVLAKAEQFRTRGVPFDATSIRAALEAEGDLGAADSAALVVALDDGAAANGRLPFLAALLRDLPPPGADDVPDLTEDLNRTDIGAGRALVALHGRDLRHVHGRGWFAWSGTRWAVDQTNDVPRRAKSTAEAMLRAAAEISDKKTREEAVQFALRACSEPRLRAMVTLAASEPGIPIQPGELDADPWLLNVANGTVDLRSGELRPHRRDDLISRIAGTDYRAGAICPAWIAFLNRTLAGNRDLIEFLRRAIGYSLTGSTREQVLFLLHGTGANGKSTVLRVLLDLLGDYGRQAPSDVLLARRNDQHPTAIAGLQGSRLVSIIEVDEGRRLAEGLVKQISGGDRVAARFMRGDFFEYDPVFKVFLAANHRPIIRGTDLAIWRRIRLIPFTVTIPPEEQDHALIDKLRAELTGILAWAVEGALEWQRTGLRPPAAVLAATDTYRADSDVLGAFLFECCTMGSDAWIPKDELYRTYTSWAERSGEQAMSKKRFGQRLMERDGIEDARDESRRFWRGIGQRNDT